MIFAKNIIKIFFFFLIFIISSYLIFDIYKIVNKNINSDQYVISECPDGEKIRINDTNNIPSIFKAEKFERAIVTKVIDGDTIELGDCRVIRYLGIDTPETVHPEKPIECFGPESSEYNKKLVHGEKILLFKGKKDKDMFGRYLRYVVVRNSGNFVNNDLVKNGYAIVYEKYKDDNDFDVYENLVYAMKNAKDKELGLWSDC